MVDTMVRRMRKELGEDARVIATGGLAGLIASETETIERVEPFLTLEGLRLIYGLNRDPAKGAAPSEGKARNE
jgi:type III pantothenate kinase